MYKTSRQRGHRRRGVVAGVISVALGLTLTACGSSSTSPSQQASSNAKNLTSLGKAPIDLTMWVLQSPTEVKTATAQVKAFEKLHPNVHIKVEESAAAGDVETQLTDAVSHSLPALIWTADVLTTAEAEHGVLLDLSPYMKAYGYSESQFVANMMDLGQYKGQQYVVPRGIDQVVLAYNPKIFHMMGVPVPKEGITWSQFAALGPKLTKKVNGVQYYALSDVGFSINSYPIQEAAVRWYGGHFTNSQDTVCELDQPAAEKGLSAFVNFSDKYSTINAHLPSSAWNAGHAAMAFVVRPQIDGWLNSAENGWSLPFAPNFVNFPLTEPNIQIPAGMSGYAATTDATGAARNAAAAYEMFLLSKQGELIRSKVAGSVPIRLDLASSTVWRQFPDVSPPINQTPFVAYDTHESLPPQLTIDTGPAYTAISNALDSVELGKSTLAAAMKTACSNIDSAIANGEA
jgi:multiple sugar transport system substrate-binding protein